MSQNLMGDHPLRQYCRMPGMWGLQQPTPPAPGAADHTNQPFSLLDGLFLSCLAFQISTLSDTQKTWAKTLREGGPGTPQYIAECRMGQISKEHLRVCVN